MRRVLFLSLAALAALFLSLLHALPAHAEEAILSYESRVRVLENGSLDVTETLRVRVEGERIRHGIYRDFPTDYAGPRGRAARVGFAVKSAERDGRPESWREERIPGGRRVYLGSKDTLVKRGTRVWVLRYVTDRQIGFFKEYDEIYWNVTGNGWLFPILSARAVVEPPAGAEILDAQAYTGSEGSTAQDARVGLEPGRAVFETLRPLPPGEGLTVTTAWPKGFVAEPTPREQVRDLLAADASAGAALAGFVAVLIYYLMAWNMVGRDPAKGPIAPLFEPPAGLSPAACRVLWRMGCDRACLAVTVLSLAAKKALSIDGPAPWSLVRSPDTPADLPPEERAVLDRLFLSGPGPLALGSQNADVRGAEAVLRSQLSRVSARLGFRENRRWLLPGLGLTLATLAAVILFLPAAEERIQAGFLALWLGGWTAGVWTLTLRARDAFRVGFIKGLPVLLFALPFWAGELIGLGILARAAGLPTALVFLAAVCLNVLFAHLLKAPSVAGRKLMDGIEGFRLFLSVAEQHRLEALNPPDLTPEVFEKYLPHALALDVENQWAERFADRLRAAGRNPADYSPTWAGSHWRGGPGGISRDLSSSLGPALSASAASRSSAPGSRSGSFGGGRSGGGGGGGGGGGW